jgi:hypothetical protein
VSTKAAYRQKLEILKAENLAAIPWLVHGFSTRRGGFSKAYGGNVLNLGYTQEDSRSAVNRNRAAFKKALAAPEWPLVTLHQVHSDLIWPIVIAPDCRRGTGGLPPRAGDGLLTNTPGILLSIRTADCLPIMLVDVKRHALGVLHAGWRGTLKRIAEKGVGEMRRSFGSRPEDLRAALGPAIHRCCYEVGEDVREQFQTQFTDADSWFTATKESRSIRDRYPLLFLAARPPGHLESLLPIKIRLDLVEANRRQLLAAGLRPRQIWASPLCTACHTNLLFSHRAERGQTGRMMAVAGIAKTRD